jgi:hypothetical protein
MFRNVASMGCKLQILTELALLCQVAERVVAFEGTSDGRYPFCREFAAG